ncbi:MAG: thioredoxin domain-containing protein [Armatimonadota bacterium]
MKLIFKIALAFVACVTFGFVARRITHRNPVLENSVLIPREQTLAFISHFNANQNNKMVVEFMDFECTPCRLAHPDLKKWLLRHPEVSFTSVHFPLDMHPHALNAAITAEMTRAKGKFNQAFDDLYEGKTKLDDKSLAAYLRAIDPSLNTDRHERELAKVRVTKDMEFVKKMKVNATPTILAWDGYALYSIHAESGLNLLEK